MTAEQRSALGGAAMVALLTVWTGPLCLLFGAGAYMLMLSDEKSNTAKREAERRKMERELDAEHARVMREWAHDLARDGFIDDPIVKEWAPHLASRSRAELPA